MAEETGNIAKLVQELRDENRRYVQQWNVWLGVGSAGGAIAMVSFAAALPNPSYAIQLFLPSLWSFMVGVTTAAMSLLFAAQKMSALGEHFAESHSREQYFAAARKIPEMISSPQRIADEANAPRNDLISKGNKAHNASERAWRWRCVWHWCWLSSLVISVIGFLTGFVWPLTLLSFGTPLSP